MRETIKVDVTNLVVGEKYFQFDYLFVRYSLASNHAISSGTYSSTHSRAPATMRKYLKNGYAVDLVLQREVG